MVQIKVNLTQVREVMGHTVLVVRQGDDVFDVRIWEIRYRKLSKQLIILLIVNSVFTQLIAPSIYWKLFACLAICGEYEILGRLLGSRVGVHVDPAVVRSVVFALVLCAANDLATEERHIHGARENLGVKGKLLEVGTIP